LYNNGKTQHLEHSHQLHLPLFSFDKFLQIVISLSKTSFLIMFLLISFLLVNFADFIKLVKL
jgi:hypothetical protein